MIGKNSTTCRLFLEICLYKKSWLGLANSNRPRSSPAPLLEGSGFQFKGGQKFCAFGTEGKITPNKFQGRAAPQNNSARRGSLARGLWAGFQPADWTPPYRWGVATFSSQSLQKFSDHRVVARLLAAKADVSSSANISAVVLAGRHGHAPRARQVAAAGSGSGSSIQGKVLLIQVPGSCAGKGSIESSPLALKRTSK